MSIDLSEAKEVGARAAWPGLPAGISIDEACRRAFAAVEAAAPLIEAQVRAQIAADIERTSRSATCTADHNQAYRHAARIAGGDA